MGVACPGKPAQYWACQHNVKSILGLRRGTSLNDPQNGKENATSGCFCLALQQHLGM